MPPKSKSRTVYVCQQCGSEQSKWMGRCPDCGEWNTLVEQVITAPTPASGRSGFSAHPDGVSGNAPVRLSQVQNTNFGRVQVPGEEFNRVLGGGIVPGSLVLIGGDPGIGKSTLLLQVSAELALFGDKPILYVSGEESPQQIKMRASRLDLNPDSLFLLAETNIDAVLPQIDLMQPGLVIIDSI